MKIGICLALLCGAVASAAEQPRFAVASIKPSAGDVQFEHDGKTDVKPGIVTMRDVTTFTCIRFAYGVQNSQISGPDWMDSVHFDIIAKAAEPATTEQMRLMMQALLADRFHLTFHRQQKEMSAYAITIAKGGPKLHESAPDTAPFRENSVNGTVIRGLTMQEFADFMATPLQRPIKDETGLKGRYDFAIDFTPYLPGGEHAMNVEFDNATGIILAAMQGELGLKMESRKESIEVLVVDHVEQPSAN
jgi:uncharacterized protein (TIGR03435 family)